VQFTPYGSSASNFSGIVHISFDLKKPTREILFHADPKLKILDPIVIKNLDNNDEITLTDEIRMPVKNEYFYIKLNKALEVGKYKISLNFVSIYSSLYGNRGLFAALYLDDNISK
jgi:hypothetical protein